MMGVAENQQHQFPSDYVKELEEVMAQVHIICIARENLHKAQMRQKQTYDSYDVGGFSLHDRVIKNRAI